jgi:hypothetical protein
MRLLPADLHVTVPFCVCLGERKHEASERASAESLGGCFVDVARPTFSVT